MHGYLPRRAEAGLNRALARSPDSATFPMFPRPDG